MSMAVIGDKGFQKTSPKKAHRLLTNKKSADLGLLWYLGTGSSWFKKPEEHFPNQRWKELGLKIWVAFHNNRKKIYPIMGVTYLQK